MVSSRQAKRWHKSGPSIRASIWWGRSCATVGLRCLEGSQAGMNSFWLFAVVLSRLGRLAEALGWDLLLASARLAGNMVLLDRCWTDPALLQCCQ